MAPRTTALAGSKSAHARAFRHPWGCCSPAVSQIDRRGERRQPLHRLGVTAGLTASPPQQRSCGLHLDRKPANPP